MNPFQMLGAIKNPQAFIQNMMGNQQVMQNPVLKNALQMAQKGDGKGLEQLARNLCQEKGINADEAASKVRNQLGM